MRNIVGRPYHLPLELSAQFLDSVVLSESAFIACTGVSKELLALGYSWNWAVLLLNMAETQFKWNVRHFFLHYSLPYFQIIYHLKQRTR